MTIHSFFHNLYVKFVPTDETEVAKLREKSIIEYAKMMESTQAKMNQIEQVNAANDFNKDKPDYTPIAPPKLNPKEKFLSFLNTAIAGYLLGVLYIIAVRFISDFLNPDTSQKQQPEPVPETKQDKLLKLLELIN